MPTTFKWDNLPEVTKKVASLVKNSKNLQRDFISLIGKETLNYLKNVTPKDTGTTANAWFIEKRTRTSITIANNNEAVLLLIQKGHSGGDEIFPNRVKALHFFIGGQEFFRSSVTSKVANPNQFMKGVNRNIDRFLEPLMSALISKYWKIFTSVRKQSPRQIRLANISKQSGIGQGTKRSRNRGRGGGFKRRTGMKGLKRRLGRRRRTGKFISSKNVQMK